MQWLVGVVVGHVAPVNDGGGARDRWWECVNCCVLMGLVYLQYIFNWTCPFVLNIQQQMTVGFNPHLLFS